LQGTALGVGAALRKVRSTRGLTLDEAARDTRIRREFLEAIEDEDFDALLGDVHVRGCLRTYASYLRLSPDKVVAAYSVARPEEPAAGSPLPLMHNEPVLWRPRRRDNHRLVVMVAAVVLVLAAAFGVLSASQPAPPPADPPSEAPLVDANPTDRRITVAVLAREPVDVKIASDGAEPERYSLAAGEGRSFDAGDTITISLSDGGAAEVSVNGNELGTPGTPDRRWKETFSYDTGSEAPAG
jgi:cytoskeletal protein RodZ